MMSGDIDTYIANDDPESYSDDSKEGYFRYDLLVMLKEIAYQLALQNEGNGIDTFGN